MHDDGLQDATLPNVFGEFFEFGFGKLAARIVGILEQARRRNDQRLASHDARCGRLVLAAGNMLKANHALHDGITLLPAANASTRSARDCKA